MRHVWYLIKLITWPRSAFWKTAKAIKNQPYFQPYTFLLPFALADSCNELNLDPSLTLHRCRFWSNCSQSQLTCMLEVTLEVWESEGEERFSYLTDRWWLFIPTPVGLNLYFWILKKSEAESWSQLQSNYLQCFHFLQFLSREWHCTKQLIKYHLHWSHTFIYLDELKISIWENGLAANGNKN